MPWSGDGSSPMTRGPHTEWYHGSPLRLDVVAAGSTVTPVIQLARAFAHKPTSLGVNFSEDGGPVTITHNGALPGFLYRVVVDDRVADLEQHPDSGFSLGEEVLATRDLPLEFIEELPVDWDGPVQEATFAP